MVLVAEPSARIDESTTVPRRHPWWWVSGVVLAALAIWLVWGLATNQKIAWDVFFTYLWSPQILVGLGVTIVLSVLSIVIATLVGVIMATAAQARNPVFRLAARAWIGFFRGLPLMVLLLVTFNLAIFVPVLGVGIPGLITISAPTNAVITGFSASIIGLSLHESAFIAEIVRGGLLSVPRGQTEAGLSIGMTRLETLFRIVYPQAIRTITPTMGNQFIMLLKASSTVAVIGGGDLLTVAQRIYGSNFETIPLLFVVSFWYLVLVGFATFWQNRLERRLGRSTAISGQARRATTVGEAR